MQVGKIFHHNCVCVSLCSACVIVVSYFWAPLTCCRTHCTAVRVVECSPLLLPNPPSDKSSPHIRPWLQSSHTLHSILSLQTEARSPLSGPHSLCVGQSSGLSAHTRHSHTHEAAPASWCKGNSRGKLADGAASLNLWPWLYTESLRRMLIKVCFLTGELTCLSGL